MPPLRPESILVKAGRPAPAPGAPLTVPISVSATFHAGGQRGYGREGNDSIAAFESALGELDGGQALAFSSGMAATTAVIEGLPAGSTVVIPTSCYQLDRTLLDAQVNLGRLIVRSVDIADTPAVVAALDGAALAWLELPTNPLLQVPDLPSIAAAARERGVLTVVDATVATPLGIRPLEHGADVVMHSVTKWLAGHSDVLMGALVAAEPDLAARLHVRRTLTGALPGSLEAFLALRGVRTLSVRLERATATTAVLAARLREHPAVTSVNYLGFHDHPQADRIGMLLSHHGALLSFTTDTAQRAAQACGRLKVIVNGTSLGGVESLMEHRGGYPGELAQGTPAELIRLSVGLEHVEDLWDDLAQALAG